MTQDFRKALDELSGLSHQDIADALGCSLAAVRQARLPDTSKAQRVPPPDWEVVVGRLAKKQAEKCLRLAERLGKRDRA